MTSENFAFWLQGYLELSQHLDGPKGLNERQVEEIKNHLNLVLTKVTPNLPMQLPLFPNLPSYIYPVTCDDSTAVKQLTYPQVSCCSGDVMSFHHTGD